LLVRAQPVDRLVDLIGEALEVDHGGELGLDGTGGRRHRDGLRAHLLAGRGTLALLISLGFERRIGVDCTLGLSGRGDAAFRLLNDVRELVAEQRLTGVGLRR
jgi:hypothetical protein